MHISYAFGCSFCSRLPPRIKLNSHMAAISSLVDFPLSVCCLLLLTHQIELYSHVGAIRSLVDFLRADGWTVAAVFALDVAFVSEPSKFIAGAMQVCKHRQLTTGLQHLLTSAALPTAAGAYQASSEYVASRRNVC